jgi:hypothetical protein
VLVNDKGDIIYITGRTGKYLEPVPVKQIGISMQWHELAAKNYLMLFKEHCAAMSRLS